MEYITLNNGVNMPMAGFGVFQIMDQKVCEESVLSAIRTGYRLIDTAAIYGNEKAVGNAIRKAIKDGWVKREELFITTKLVDGAGYEKTKAAFEKSLDNLGLDYIDLYLIHRPMGDYYGSWRAMEELYEASNFESGRMVDLIMNNKIVPAVNQIESHPFFQQEEARRYMEENGVRMEAWAPFAEGKDGIFSNPVLTEIGQKYGKSPAQVILRYDIQRGIIPLAKSVHENRMKENINIFDFALSDDDMKKIATLDENTTLFGDNNNPEYVKMINSVKMS
ncbi:oxidoreductase, aldo/keto reductase family [Lachnospiraceae bacterium TWA4]|nr:oxidoreductase, aldo/keto reductase family [Lachnospiraceae bacterium TWA4]